MLFRDVVSGVASGQQERSVLAFYIKRIGQERLVRNLSLVILLAVVGVQLISWVAPPKISQASSGSANDVIFNGFKSKADLLSKFDANPELRAIYGRFNIGRAEIVNSHQGSVNSSANVWSAGRWSHGDPAQNILLDVPGAATTIYLRPLKVWGSGVSYTTLTGTTASGQQFWLLFDCGNPVIDQGAIINPAAKVTPVPATPVPPTPPSATPPPTPVPSAPPTPQPEAQYSCDLLKAYPDAANSQHNPPLKVTFEVDSTAVNTTRQGYEFDYGDGTTAAVTNLPVAHTYAQVGDWVARVRVKTAAGTTSYSPACSQTLHVVSPELVYLKTATNLTVKDAQGQPTNAAGTTVQSGNQIRYTLSVKNSGTAAVADFQFKEDIGDIKQYADVTDLGGAQAISTPVVGQVGLVQENLIWSKLTIPAGQTVTKSFVVKVKLPIPTTPRGISDPGSFDLTMENTFYKNIVVIKVAPPVVKQVETVSKALPDTGPGVASFWLALFAAGGVFIALRQKLIGRELELIVASGGHQG